MAIEIERKYLVINESFIHDAKVSRRIVQGYLNRDPERTVRVRIVGEQAFLTIKGVSSRTPLSHNADSRLEIEVPIDLNDAKDMLRICEGTIIDKTRYYVPFGGFTWEIDVFGGALSGLIIAEVELPDSTVNPPLPAFIGKEVTRDRRFYNSNLSRACAPPKL